MYAASATLLLQCNVQVLRASFPASAIKSYPDVFYVEYFAGAQLMHHSCASYAVVTGLPVYLGSLQSMAVVLCISSNFGTASPLPLLQH
jgi:hypothetical protein